MHRVFFVALSLCFHYITAALTLKIFFFLFKQHILFSSWNAELGAEIGLQKENRVGSDPF